MPFRLLLFHILIQIAGLLAVHSLPAIAAQETRNVLVLYSNGRLLPANIEADRGLREAIRTPEGRPVIMYDEFLDVPRFGGEGHTRTVATYLREKYACSTARRDRRSERRGAALPSAKSR